MAASSRRGSAPIAIGSCHATSIIPHRDFPSEFDALWRQTLSVAQSLRHRRMPCHAYYTIFLSRFEVQHSKIHIKMSAESIDMTQKRRKSEGNFQVFQIGFIRRKLGSVSFTKIVRLLPAFLVISPQDFYLLMSSLASGYSISNVFEAFDSTPLHY